MINEEIVGTDINYNWVLNKDGDLQVVKGGDNLSQAIYLRLTALLNSMDWAYTDYGSEVKEWLGKNQNIYTRNTLVAEISKRISYDQRVYNAEVEIVDWTGTTIGIKITAHLKDGTTFQEYYIFSDLPRKDDNINSPLWHNTWIDTKEEGYFAKVGEYVTVQCYVRYKEKTEKDEVRNNIVPIGNVSLYIGSYHVDIENNPQEIAPSGSAIPGLCTFTFRVPPFIKKGTHELRFKYEGIRGYNNCEGYTNLYVVDKLPTNMYFKYPIPTMPWYYANPVDTFSEPIVHVIDANDYDVMHGEVKYYLSDFYEEDTLVYIQFPILFHNTTLLERTVYIYCDVNVLNFTSKYIFRFNYMFRPHDIIELVSADGRHIDYLECLYENKIFYLVSSRYTKPYEVDDEGNVLDNKRNMDIATLRHSNTHIVMEVVE